ncbi:hypothetical protein [Thermococcus sp. MAR1]|uniref:hypothetical protein n=1 Tax=Thermococcus sp. MAR1 TaxID=1638263 RepID=UPI00143A2B51|nr:hypothetical protein [Thermococcus sp. MAR1]NJE10855.1 hypothetical protein [Thermococcus sp. MAR1]
MRTIIITDWKRHILHPLLVASASRALHRGNLGAFEAVAAAFERNYFFERVVKMPADCFGKYLGESILLGVQAGFSRLDELLPEAEGEGVRIVEVARGGFRSTPPQGSTRTESPCRQRSSDTSRTRSTCQETGTTSGSW